MPRTDNPDDHELRDSFDGELASVCNGCGLHTETGLDAETGAALMQILRAYPAVTDELVAAARAAFAGQLDGSNGAARRAAMEAVIAEHNRRLQSGAKGSRSGGPARR